MEMTKAQSLAVSTCSGSCTSFCQAIILCVFLVGIQKSWETGAGWGLGGGSLGESAGMIAPLLQQSSQAPLVH